MQVCSPPKALISAVIAHVRAFLVASVTAGIWVVDLAHGAVRQIAHPVFFVDQIVLAVQVAVNDLAQTRKEYRSSSSMNLLYAYKARFNRRTGQ